MPEIGYPSGTAEQRRCKPHQNQHRFLPCHNNWKHPQIQAIITIAFKKGIVYSSTTSIKSSIVTSNTFANLINAVASSIAIPGERA